MSRAEQQETRATYLLGLLCDERLRDEEAVELAELLATSDAARRRHVETVQLRVDLADWSQPAGVVPISHPAVDVAVNSHTPRNSVTPVRTSETTRVGKDSLLSHGQSWLQSWLPWGAAAATLLMVSIWGWSHFNQDSTPLTPSQSLANIAASGDAKPAKPDKFAPSASFVARVVEVTADAKWDEDLNPREFLMRLRAGDKLRLLAAMARLEFYSGARIILQGPTEFTPTGSAKGSLESGRLTGEVNDGKLQLTTPSAKVVDLGTEFGVSVGPTSDTDVCVFDGEVQVRPGLDGSKDDPSATEPFHLTQGMSVRVAATGKVSDGMDAGVDYDIYTRSFPLAKSLNPNKLDLVDIVCGGNGQGMRLAAAIDPLTGQWDRRPWNNSLGPGTRHGDRLFHRAEWHPFTDGTFVPNQFGEPVQVDTLGGTVVMLKDRGHYTWGPIWARRAVKDSTVWDRSADSWGAKTYPVITERLTRSRLGGIGIHASVGITFDLKAIGREHPSQINRFTGVLVNLENSKEHNPEWASKNPAPSADLRIFVDGQSRYEKLNFARNVEGEPIDVDLSSHDRFLTFVTTDAGNTNRYDHIVIIDPVLGIQGTDQATLSRAAPPVKVRWAN